MERSCCHICGKNIFEEPNDYFMVKNFIWKEICQKGKINSSCTICWKCSEKFLGRKIKDNDLTNAPVNDSIKSYLKGTYRKVDWIVE